MTLREQELLYAYLDGLHCKIDEIERGTAEKGVTLVPMRVYFKDGRAKVELAVARGRKHYDKRQAIAAREASREAARAVGRRTKGLD